MAFLGPGGEAVRGTPLKVERKAVRLLDSSR